MNYLDHEYMVEREIDRQADLMRGLTREDAEIMAHDRLNPGFGLTLAAEAALLADRRDAEIMASDYYGIVGPSFEEVSEGDTK